MNTSAPWLDLAEAEARVLKIQTKLHQWAIDGGDRCFDDLHNLVCDPAFLLVGWNRLRGNRGGRSAGVDGVAPRSIDSAAELRFLTELRDDLRSGRFRPCSSESRGSPGCIRRVEGSNFVVGEV